MGNSKEIIHSQPTQQVNNSESHFIHRMKLCFLLCRICSCNSEVWSKFYCAIRIEIQKKQETCTICLDELVQSERVRTPCDHGFHLHCILNWLNEKEDCPLCRTKLKNVSGKIALDFG